MRFYHLARPHNIEAALSSGVLEPTGYPDLAPCETMKLRGHGPVDPERFCTCPLPHNRTPVTWLYRAPFYTPMLGPTMPAFYMTLDLPSARIWKLWALSRGAAQRWVDIKARIYGFSRMYAELGYEEYVSLDPIPSDQWVKVVDMTTHRQVWP